MTSLMEVTELPTDIANVNAGHTAPLLSDLSLASVLSAALETIPSMLSESLPATYFARQLHFVRPMPALAHVQWLRELERQDGNALVLDRRGLTARGGLLPDDHLFKSMARKGLIRDNHVVWAARYTPLAGTTAQPAATARTGSASSSADLSPLAPSASAPVLGAVQQQMHPVAATTTATTAATTTAAAAAAATTLLTPTVFNVYALSSAVCGHRGIVHGGLSSAIIDETFGYLLYLLYAATADTTTVPAAAGPTTAPPAAVASAEAASVAAAVRETTRGPSGSGAAGDSPGDLQRELSGVWAALANVDIKAAMTAHLEVDFVRPLPSDSIVVCVAQVERVEGRKVWLQAQLMSRPPTSRTGDAAAAVVYARGKALFVTPRPQGGSASSSSASLRC